MDKTGDITVAKTTVDMVGAMLCGAVDTVVITKQGNNFTTLDGLGEATEQGFKDKLVPVAGLYKDKQLQPDKLEQTIQMMLDGQLIVNGATAAEGFWFFGDRSVINDFISGGMLLRS